MTPEYEAVRARVAEIANTPAYLAGGAVRDTLLGGSVKDLDIYVDLPSGVDANSFLEDLASSLDADPFFGATYRVTDPDYFGPEYAGIVDWTPQAGPPVQIVVVAPGFTAAKIHETFSDGISQASFDGHTVSTTPAFERDRAARKVTLLRHGRTREQRTTNQRHAQRVASKYGWQWQAAA